MTEFIFDLLAMLGLERAGDEVHRRTNLILYVILSVIAGALVLLFILPVDLLSWW